MSLAFVVDRRAEVNPDGDAVADGAQSLTNAQLLDRVRGAARHLKDLGIHPGDVIALRLPNRVEFVVLLLAGWRLGAAITPINPSLTDVEVHRQLVDSGACLLVAEHTASTHGVATLAVTDLNQKLGWPDLAEPPNPSALALLIYTSGTTGIPKGVMLDHANLDAMTAMGLEALELSPADRCLLLLPLFHVNGIVVSVLTPLLAGASIVIAERFDPRTLFDVVERERPTFFSAVPTIYTMLAALPAHVQPDTSSLRFAICGAAPAPPDLLWRFEDRYGFPLIEGYGLSEGTCATTLNPVTGPRRPGTVGVALPGQEIRIVDSGGAELGPGLDGEVCVRGPNIMRGYLGRPDDTARAIIDGWLRTGDVGHLDADGYLTLVGRSKDMIIRGGENIYPKEIEDVLTSDPTVLEAAVVGVPDEKWGEVVVAYVEPHPGVTIDAAALRARCAGSLSGYKRPTDYVVIDEIPKNALGKIDKSALRSTYSEASIRRGASRARS